MWINTNKKLHVAWINKRVNIIIHYGHDIQLLIVNCDIYGTDITTVKYWKLRNGIKITHDIIKIDSRHLILEF
jgi:hypothetical protein